MKTIIMAGGSGTRLWPLSREKYPKQFIKIFGERSLFQRSLNRAHLFSKENEIYVVSRKDYEFLIKNQIEELGLQIPERNILLEPMARNTLPAIFWGVKTILEEGGAVVSVLPADHVVENMDEYRRVFNAAEKLAEDYLVVFGIKPDMPHTGYGYIKPGKKIEGGYLVDAFVEKPDFERAKKYVREGYLWNSGIFIFHTSVFMEEVNKYLPDLPKIFSGSDVESIYPHLPTISMDYGIMEKTQRAAVVKFKGVWSDLGTYESMYHYLNKDEMGNAATTEHIANASENNLVYGNKLVVTIGVKDLVVVDTPDVLLVGRRTEEKKVKDIFSSLKNAGDERAYISTTVYRPWGRYTVLGEGKNYKIKEFVVIPGRKISLQRHKYRSEHWVIVEGKARITIGDRVFELSAGMSTYVPVGMKHRVENIGDEPLKIVEVQMGSYVGEDDIERFEDDYGRVPKAREERR